MTNTNGLTSKGIQEGKLAVVTGGADGIGLACAEALANKGMRIALVDKDAEKLADAANSLPASCEARTFCIDVTDREAMLALGERVRDELGDVSVLMNNAAMAANPGAPWENPEGWDTLLDVNLTGVMNGVFAFVPAMIASGASGCVINTGSKQGITRPPGNAAYNVSKTAVLGYSEMLSHALRNSDNANISAHLLVPGFTYTGYFCRKNPTAPGGPRKWLNSCWRGWRTTTFTYSARTMMWTGQSTKNASPGIRATS